MDVFCAETVQFFASIRRRLNHHAEPASKHLLVNDRWQLVSPSHKKSEVFKIDLLKRLAAGGLQANSKRRAGAQLRRQVQFLDIAREITSFQNPQRQQLDVMGSLK